jgi:hypothetical protein
MLSARTLVIALAALVVAACGPGNRSSDYRAFTQHYAFRISSEPLPPMAREKVRYKVVVRDKDTNQPLQGGEGILYAESHDGVKTWDSFTAGPELGTYYANLNFLTAGDWAMGLRFRRDSAVQLEQADWMQEVSADTSKIP